jgi:hypothetical protein
MDRPIALLLPLAALLSVGCATRADLDRREELRRTLRANISAFPECAATAPRESVLAYDCKLEVRAWMRGAQEIAEQLRPLEPKHTNFDDRRCPTCDPPVEGDTKADNTLQRFDRIAEDVASFNYGPPPKPPAPPSEPTPQPVPASPADLTTA